MPHLHWMANKGYLRRHPYGQGYVFNITETGYVRCKDFYSIDLDFIPNRYEEPSGTQLEHELLITKTAIGIYKHIRESDNIELLRDHRFMLEQLEWVDPESGEVTHPFEKIIPDYWYMVRTDKGMKIRFVEAIVGEASPTRVRQKFREYQQGMHPMEVGSGMAAEVDALRDIPWHQLTMTQVMMKKKVPA